MCTFRQLLAEIACGGLLMRISRRDAMKLAGAGTAGAILTISGIDRIMGQEAGEEAAASTEKTEEQMGRIEEYQLAALPYEYNALEPVISEQTVRIHHDKHHRSEERRVG